MSRPSTPSLSPCIRSFQFITRIIFHTTNTMIVMVKLIIYILISTNVLILWQTVYDVHTMHDYEDEKTRKSNDMGNEIEEVIEARIFKFISVVVTTCQNGTCSMLTSAKLSVGYLVMGITRELNKKPSLHCSSIYINTMWSMLQQYLPALMSMPLPHVLLLIYHAIYMCSDIILLISAVHVCTICTP